MILISHRGNTEGPNPSQENNPKYIDLALHLNYDVEIDLWIKDGKLFLGHDNPQYEIDFHWIGFRKDKLWLHCKNIEAVEFCYSQSKLNYFWHDTDTLTITSKGFLWAYPGKQPIKESIAVLPELYKDDVSSCIGICSDFISNYNHMDKTRWLQ
jgi:hypothetical protein